MESDSRGRPRKEAGVETRTGDFGLGRSAPVTDMHAKILIVDDHEIVREGIRRLLSNARPEWEICGEAANGKQAAIDAVQRLKPDIAILGHHDASGMSGLEATPHIVKQSPDLPHINLHYA